MTTFDGFPPNRLKTIKADLGQARKLSTSCTNSLLLRPGNPKISIMELLRDTFMITIQDWQKSRGWDMAGKVKDVFFSFGPRIDRTKLIYTRTSPTDPGEMQLGAYVIANRPTEIHVTASYFKESKPKSRAAVLIHEYVHLLDPRKGHPGGVKIVFGGQTALEIPYAQAVANPYCYQYFAEWL